MNARTWLLPDPHFLDTGPVRMGRPATFTERIIKAWKREVAPSDLLLCLGDLGKNDILVHDTLLCDLPGTRGLIRGNHDKRSDIWYRRRGWAFVCETMLVERLGKRVLLSHIPQPDLGYFDLNIHGHFHNTDHRRHQPEFAAILTEKHWLLALEWIGYQPVLLDTVIEGKIGQLSLSTEGVLCNESRHLD